ncbi:MAG TPA: Ig-like domain-containing protein [Gemmatimonadaceae bacterium]|nr:Ig-like domain-containing protein [Gemmatimonadaceae bacterium]
MSIVIASPSLNLAEGQAYPLTATVSDARGIPTIRTITWTSTAPEVVSVGSDGIVVAHTPGQARVIASVGGAADTASISVSLGQLAITPGAVSAVVGSELQFTASLPGASNAAMSVSWTSSDPKVATIDESGTLSSLLEGTITVQASAGGRSGNATVKVNKRSVESITISPATSSIFPGETTSLVARMWNGSGKEVNGRSAVWSSSDEGVATVDGNNGTVKGMAQGTAIIVATVDGARATATVNVLGVPVSTVQVSLPSSVLPSGGSMQASVVLRDASGTALTDRAVAWQSSNSSIATVDANGIVKAVANGNVNISAVSEGKVGSAALVVATPVASGVVIEPKSVSVMEGMTAPMTASVVDQGGTPISGKTVSWSSDNTGVVTVGQDGKVRGVSGGTATVRAFSGSLSATSTVTVTSVPVASVEVSPEIVSQPVGYEATLTALARDASGNVLSGRPAAWSSSNPAVATVDARGEVAGVTSGTAIITAAIEGQTAQSQVTITAAKATVPAVASITVTLAASSLSLGESTQASAVLRDAQGNVMSGQPIDWGTPAPGLISVSSTGLVTALGAGTAAVTASSGDKMGAATVTIAATDGPPASVASVALTIASNSLVVGESTQATAVLRDAQGHTLSGRTIAWSVVPATVATISPDGLITATAPGSATITATSEGKSASAAFTVYTMAMAPVASLSVTLNSPAIMDGQTTQAYAVAKSATGAAITGRSISWSSTNTSVATVDAGGRVSGTGAGSANIRGVVDGVSGAATLTVGSSSPTVASVTVTLGSSSITVGSSTQALATARDAGGNAISGQPVSWSVSNGAMIATISSNGTVSGVAVGNVIVTATVNGVSGTATLSVTSGTASKPPPSGSGIAVAVQRFDGGSGSVLVSNAIPLPQGSLFPADAQKVRVFVNGAEQSVYSEALKGLHADGSLRSVLVQFQYSVPSSGSVAGQVVLGQARATTDLAKPSANRSQLTAVALPTDVNYLLSTGINGPTISVAENKAQGGAFLKYENDFVKFADYHWALSGASWLENYYDRALIYYAFWVRSGNPEYFRRASLLAVNYRRDYLEKNNYGSSPHWSQLEGLEQHYLLTGDEASRTAVGRTAQVMSGYHTSLNDLTKTWLENRIQARVLQSYLLAWRIQAPGDNWASRLDDGLTRVLSTQRADGSYGPFPNTCNGSLNYMTGLLNDIMIKYYRQYKADSRIPGAIGKSLDYLWTQWIPTSNAFKYISVQCVNVSGMNVGGPTPAPDLNNFFVTGYSWYGRISGDATYSQRAEVIFNGGVNQAFLNGTKQFNENYSASFRFLDFRK